MKAWSFYDSVTGQLSGRTFAGSARALERNTPPGMAAIEGRHDHLTHRVDVISGTVVPREDAAQVAAAVESDVRSRSAQGQIDYLERVQARVMREAVLVLLGLLPDGTEKQTLVARLQQLEARIVALRQQL